MYYSPRIFDHYLTYETLIHELRRCGDSVRQSRQFLVTLRAGGLFILGEPSYVDYPVCIEYNPTDKTYNAYRTTLV